MSIILHDECAHGRLGNQLLQNIGLSVLAKKYDLMPFYHPLTAECAQLGFNLFRGGRYILQNIVHHADANLGTILQSNEPVDHGIIYNGYFQMKELTSDHRELVEEVVVKQQITHPGQVFVHVRLDDVERFNPGINYYRTALSKIPTSSGVISSDSPNNQLVKMLANEFQLQIYNNNPMEVLLEGASYEYRIVSGGSFSWLIGFLGNNDNVIHPMYTHSRVYYGDMFTCPQWQSLPY